MWQAAVVGRFHQPDRLLLAGEELIAVGPEQPSTSINKSPSSSVGLEVGWSVEREGILERAIEGREMWETSDFLWHLGQITFKTKHCCWTAVHSGWVWISAWVSQSSLANYGETTKIKVKLHYGCVNKWAKHISLTVYHNTFKRTNIPNFLLGIFVIFIH